MTKDMTLDERILEEIHRQKLSPEEAKAVLQNLKGLNPNRYTPRKVDLSDKHFKYGWVSDAHMGHSCYRPDIMDVAAETFKKEKVDFIVNPGDTIEGMSGRDGHIFELTHLGATAQIKYFGEEMQKLADFPVYSIEATGSHGGWFGSKGNAGLDIGDALAKTAPNYDFLGYDEQDLELDNGIIIRLRHPGGGTAYAISYKMQKYIESISGGSKPNIVHQGHFHKFNHLFYRNVHAIDSGTLADQTPFMKKIGTPAHTGFGVVDCHVGKTGVERLSVEWVPFYD